MRIRLEATQGELEQRSDVLVEQLCKALETAAPDTAAILRKAVPEHEKAASAPVLQTILKKQRAEYARLNKMMLDEILKVLSSGPGELKKSAGPFIGPRGGKWEDAKHTIPWKAAQLDLFAPKPKKKAAPAVTLQRGKTFKVYPHGRLFGDTKEIEFRVVSTKGDKVTVSRHKDVDYGPTMPKASLKHFINDLAGKVDLPPGSGRPEIEAVTSGKAEFLGKGDDGLAFKVGGTVVKVSTTVPYQPENPGHRTPQEAADMLRGQVEVGNRLAAKVKGIQRSEFVQHGDKGFQIKPWVEIPEKWSRDDLERIQDIVIGVHEQGYAIHDTIQAGRDADGKIVLFDIGKAGPRNDKPATDMWSDVYDDMSNLRRLYEESGEVFVRRDLDEGMQYWQKVEGHLPRWLKEGKFDFARHHIDEAVKKRKAIASASLSGEELEDAHELIDFEVLGLRTDVKNAEKKAEGAK